METIEEDHYSLLILHLVALPQDLIPLGREAESGGGRMKPEGLPQAGFEVRKLRHVLHGDEILAYNLIDFRLKLEVGLRVGKEFVEQERKETRSCFVAWGLKLARSVQGLKTNCGTCLRSET